MDINISNFFEASQGCFKEINRPQAVKLLEAFKQGLQSVVIQGRTWTLNYVSRSKYYNSISIYWTCGDYLIRQSDHWSFGPKGPNKCAIRRCFWGLNKTSNDLELDIDSSKYRLYTGIIHFGDLHPNNGK